MAGYPKKVLEAKLGQRVTEQWTRACHTVGHWTSTLFVLNVCGIAELRQTAAHAPGATINLALAEDAAIRVRSLPAGTHRLGAAFVCAQKLVAAQIARFCPNGENFPQLPIRQALIMAHPARYHIGALYLTGNARAEHNGTPG